MRCEWAFPGKKVVGRMLGGIQHETYCIFLDVKFSASPSTQRLYVGHHESRTLDPQAPRCRSGHGRPRGEIVTKAGPLPSFLPDEAYRENCRIRQYFIQRCSQVVDTKEMEPLGDVGIDAMIKDMQNMGVWTSIVPGRLGSLHLLRCSWRPTIQDNRTRYL